MTEHVLVFGVGYDIPARMRAFGAAAGREVTTSVMCWPEHLEKIDDSGEHRRILVMRPEASEEEWIALARAIHAVDPVTRIGSFYDDCRPQAAAAARALGLDTHRAETVEIVMNKYAMRQRLADTGVESTSSAVVESADALRAFADGHGYPCVVKPLTGAASRGVSVIHEPAQAQAALERAGGAGLGPQATVEEFLAGPQFSVEAFSELGEHVVVTITRKYSDPVSLVELGHVMPAPLDPDQTAAVRQHVIATLDALGIEFGPTHTEVILTRRGPRIIETHLRTGGDELWNMVTDATGVDLIESQLRQVLGEKVLPGIRETLDDPGRVPRAEAIWFAGAPAEGTLLEVTGTDAVRPDHVKLHLLGAPGAELAGLQNSFSRLAWARAHAATAQEAVTEARAAIDALAFVTRVPAAAPADLL
ncbi:ATP-grasp domain-containing protein [Streptomyces sp. AP-93]|uniref:ATP-grasp domain-containing protein n=1 Tax=Streptomyces sp. AP-93 TaxID=2929048 RepID=UPI001FAEE84E|nr:ATP-grasp domain-containing protein [Streptomyces sp. AP-93]MCJ0873385.1 ATP-grasp domain-containing protein [Streptomyces sp. AP-93]